MTLRSPHDRQEGRVNQLILRIEYNNNLSEVEENGGEEHQALTSHFRGKEGDD